MLFVVLTKVLISGTERKTHVKKLTDFETMEQEVLKCKHTHYYLGF